MKVFKMILSIIIFKIIQYKLGRKIVKGKFKKIQPRIDGIGPYWTKESYINERDTILKKETYK
jgi:hypothetical protein